MRDSNHSGGRFYTGISAATRLLCGSAETSLRGSPTPLKTWGRGGFGKRVELRSSQIHRAGQASTGNKDQPCDT